MEDGMSKNRTLIIVVSIVAFLVLLLVAIPMVFASIVNQATEKAMLPFEQANEQLKTQVSQFLHPTPTIIPDPVTIIHELKSLARLETIQYSVEKVITAESRQGQFAALFGDKLLFVAHGKVIAGIDMEKLTSSDITLSDGILYVTLPEPEIFIATLDNDQSYVYDRETGIFTKGSPELETLARQAAEDEILEAAIKDGILDMAQANAENYLTRLFKQLDYDEVVFVPSTSSP
jgi:hypothetical protein